jgi:agmatinase
MTMNLEGLKPWAGLAGAPLEGADVVLAGIPYDGSATYRKGAAAAPARIRELSAVIPPVTETGRLLDGMRVHDLGDLDPGPDIEQGWQGVADRLASIPTSSFLTVVGGDHCATIPVLAAQARRHPGLSVLWVDAHPDLCDFSRGGRWTCGCALIRAVEVAGMAAGNVMIAGGRDFDPEELEFIRREGVLMLPVAAVASDPRAAGEALAQAAQGRPLHVSFDIDALDPANAPGTEIPSAGGLSTRQALDLLAALSQGAQLVGFDVVEVAPALDSNDITSLAALKLIFESWGRVWKQPM